MVSSKPYDTLPDQAAQTVKPFTVAISEEDVQRMKDLIKLSIIADPVHENSLPDGSRRLGLRRDWLLEAERIWESEYDWRRTEEHINSFPNYKAKVHDQLGELDVHFAGLFSSRENAIPIVLLHGWPGSFLEFLPMLELLRKKYDSPEKLPYHVIIPSLPGYAFSQAPPVQHDFSPVEAARVIDSLMHQLGFGSGYIAQGGDVGSRVARSLGVNHKSCKAVHLKLCLMNDESKMDVSELSESQKVGQERYKEWRATGNAYALEQGTRPATLGFVLNSNPIATLAWIGEKFLEWSDIEPSLPEILAAASLYFLTRCTHSNMWSYRHAFLAGAKGHDHPDNYLKVPMGYSLFPNEIQPTPVVWVKKTGDLVWSNDKHERGGHFAAWEVPEALLADVEAFVGEVWRK